MRYEYTNSLISSNKELRHLQKKVGKVLNYFYIHKLLDQILVDSITNQGNGEVPSHAPSIKCV